MVDSNISIPIPHSLKPIPNLLETTSHCVKCGSGFFVSCIHALTHTSHTHTHTHTHTHHILTHTHTHITYSHTHTHTHITYSHTHTHTSHTHTHTHTRHTVLKQLTAKGVLPADKSRRSLPGITSVLGVERNTGMTSFISFKN